MLSLVTKKCRFENSDCSSIRSLPIYKRRKVFAVREFPPGCGPNAAPINLHLKEIEDGGQTTGFSFENAESNGRKEGDLHVIEGKAFLEVVESQSHDIRVFTRSSKGASSLKEAKNVENESEELSELLVDIRSNDQPENKPVLAQESKKTEKIYESTDDICDPSKDVTDVGIESPSVSNNTGALDLQEAGMNIMSVTLDEISSLPHYPISSSFVWKERKYPPRKRVSAVRDFPARYGRNMGLKSEIEENHASLGKSMDDFENEKEVLVVLGLMASSNSLVTKRKRAVKSTTSLTSIKQSKGKKSDYDKKDKPKLSPNKSKESTKKLGESSKMSVPYVGKTETNMVSNVHEDEGDSSENEESLDVFQLVPRTRDVEVSLPPYETGLSNERDAQHKVREIL